MKKSIIAVICLLFSVVVLPVYAEEYPMQEVSGVISAVKVGEERIIIEFKDGRMIFFDGNYAGKVFEVGKECKITYKYAKLAFASGTYIIKTECKK